MGTKNRDATEPSSSRHHRRQMAGLDPVAAENALRILRGGMARSLGLRLTEVKPNILTAQMKLLSRHLNYNGRVNGGAIIAICPTTHHSPRVPCHQGARSSVVIPHSLRRFALHDRSLAFGV